MFLFAFFLPRLGAVEYTDGSVKLVLWEDNGRFSLYAKNAHSQYVPFFTDQDPRTSFLAVMVNDHSYKLGDTSSFKIRLGGDSRKPSLVFESSFLLVTEEFSFIQTSDAGEANGVSITITIENKVNQQSMVGLRYLLDTSLGEYRSGPPFAINAKAINSETLIEKGASTGYWVSENDTLSLTGSLSGDSIHFANWKRLNDVPWKTPYAQGRNFNSPPYSVGDSAVCYYFEPKAISRGETRTVSFTLAAGRSGGFPVQTAEVPPPAPETSETPETPAAVPTAIPEPVVIVPAPVLSPEDQKDRDLALIRQLIGRIDGYMISGAATEEELSAMEYTLGQLMAKYGMEPHTRP
ncbi:hypothetical protein TREAZ_0529 [Leadbettera azotonutricia ZAS-9]|uniref:Uncharacterized protein n=1 Tax=Leadbettera azotonutricia (strain ATCC BAA-888 / DSM 13862 / ZAS-9) TaxID=545695 RepID=F5YC44_LEAAZ|nr:hypothetical protein TREAZ_0529 [Leadbettera azotonutricia ZAS-9]